jgi:hypothetical protein
MVAVSAAMTFEGLRFRLDHRPLIQADSQNDKQHENKNDDRDDDALISRHMRVPTAGSDDTRNHLEPNGRLARVPIFRRPKLVESITDYDCRDHQYVPIRQFGVTDGDASNHGIFQRANRRHIRMDQKEARYGKDSPSIDE